MMRQVFFAAAPLCSAMSLSEAMTKTATKTKHEHKHKQKVATTQTTQNIKADNATTAAIYDAQKHFQRDPTYYWQANPYYDGHLLYGESVPEDVEQTQRIYESSHDEKVDVEQADATMNQVYLSLHALQQTIWDEESCGDSLIASKRQKEHVLQKTFTHAEHLQPTGSDAPANHVKVETSLIIAPEQARLWAQAMMTAVEERQSPFDLCSPNELTEYMNLYSSSIAADVRSVTSEAAETARKAYPIVILACVVVLLILAMVLYLTVLKKKDDKEAEGDEEAPAESTDGESADA